MSRFEFRGAGLPSDVSVVALRGHETVWELYAFEVWLSLKAADAASLDVEGTIGAAATLVVKASQDAEDELTYHGVVREFALVHAAAGLAVLRLVLVPALWRLTESRHSRVYTAVTFDAALTDVLDRDSLTGDFGLSEDHPTEEHIVQYRESDYAFFARWLEREGCHHFFTHAADGPEKLVVRDSSSAAETAAGDAAKLRYAPVVAGDVSAKAAVTSFRAVERARLKSATVNDYDHLRPALAITGTASIDGEGGDVVRHEERTFDPSDAKRLATLASEAAAAHETVFVGRATVLGIRPGFVVELEDHPRGALNQKYFVTRVVHRGAQAGALLTTLGLDIAHGYEVTFECIAASVPYRPLRRTPWPRVHGYQLGQIDGPADDDYAQLDEHGRYFVKLFCDESDLEGDKASTRIRMLQPHAGAPEGWHFPLRKKTEVIVEFMGGDPDRPVIAGGVPNAENPSLVTSDNASQNVLQTGGLTRLEVEDEKDKQYIWLRTPPADTFLNLGFPSAQASHPHAGATHNISLHSDKDALYDIGSNQLIEVGGELDEQVVSDVKETYQADQTSKIEGPQTTTVDNAVSETYLATQKTTVTGKPRTELFHNGQSSLVLGARQETYASGQKQTVVGSTTETWIGGSTRTVGATTETHNGGLTELVTGPSLELCPSGVNETYGPTTGLWASLLWVCPAIVWKMPTITFTRTSKWSTKVKEKAIQPVISSWANSPPDVGSLKLESLGISISICASFKGEANGINIAMVGPSIERGGNKVDLIAFCFTTEGFELVT